MKKKLFKLDLKEFSNFQQSKKDDSQSTYVPKGQVSPHIKKNETEDAFNFIELIKVWPEIVGVKIAEHTIPLKNTYQTLVILSNHSVFAQELSFMEVALRKKIYMKFPRLAQSIKQLKFVVDSDYFNTQKNFQEKSIDKKPKYTPPHAFSPEFKKLKAEAELLFKDIEDPDLKKDLISLYFQSKTKSH